MPQFQYVSPERANLQRARFVHIALPNSQWTLCDRAKAGVTVDITTAEFDITDICPRCNTRKRYLERGEKIRRQSK